MSNPDDSVNVVDLLQVLSAWENEIRIAAADLDPASRSRMVRVAVDYTRQTLAAVGRVGTTMGPLITRDEDTEELLTATVSRSEHPGVPASAPRAMPRAAVREESAHDDGPEGTADLSQPMSTDETPSYLAPTPSYLTPEPAPAPAVPSMVDFGGGAAPMPDFGTNDLPDFGGGTSSLVDFGTPELPDFGSFGEAKKDEPSFVSYDAVEPEPEPVKVEEPAPEPEPVKAAVADVDEGPGDVPDEDDPTPQPDHPVRRASFVDDESPLVSASPDEDDDSTQIKPLTHDVRAALEQAKARAPVKRSSSRGPAMQDTFDIAPDASFGDDDVDLGEEDASDRPSGRGVVVKPSAAMGDFDTEELTNVGPLRTAAAMPTDHATAKTPTAVPRVAAAPVKPAATVSAPKAAVAPSLGAPKAATSPSFGAPKAAASPSFGAPKAAVSPTIGGPKPAGAPVVAGARAGAAVGIGKGSAAVGVGKAAPAAAAAAAGARRPIGGAPLPTIRDGTDPKPRSAAVQLGAKPGQSSKVLGFEEEEEPLEMGEAEGDVPEGDGFSLAVEEYEEDEYEDEEEEEEEEAALVEPTPEPVQLAPEPQGPDPAVLAKLMDKAAEAKDVNDMDAAIAAYSDLLDLDPDHLRAHLARGLIYLAQADYARAMSDFTVAEDLDPKDPNPQVAIGELFYNRKDYRKAIDYFNAAIELDPNHANAYCQRGIAYYYRKEYDDAVRDLTKAQKLNPEIPNITTFLSMAKKKAVPVKK